MSYRSLALAAAVGALSAMHIGSAAAQSVYVAPGGIYIGAGAGPVYVTPPAPINGAAAYVGPGYGYGHETAAYVGPGYGYGHETAAYVEPDDDYGDGPAVYVEPSYGYGYGPGPYVGPRYGYGYGPRPYAGPRYGYGYGPAVPNRRYYSGPRSAYAAALPPRPRVAVPYRAGRCVARHCY
jgi:hypothetical protein